MSCKITVKLDFISALGPSWAITLADLLKALALLREEFPVHELDLAENALLTDKTLGKRQALGIFAEPTFFLTC